MAKIIPLLFNAVQRLPAIRMFHCAASRVNILQPSLASTARQLHSAVACSSFLPPASSSQRSHVCLSDQLPGMAASSSLLQPRSAWGPSAVRTVIRNHFPRPNERRRIKRHGWRARMATVQGRRILMRRILKGRHVISH